MTTLNTTYESFLKAAAADYEGTKYHALPLFFTHLFQPDSRSVIIARGKKREEVQHKFDMMQSYCVNKNEVSYSAHYSNIIGNVRSMIRFISTGPVAMRKLNRWNGVTNVMLYGFELGTKEFETAYEMAEIAISKSSNGNIVIVP